MAWLYLITAGIFECFWSTMMKLSAGFTRPIYTISTLFGMVVSFGALIIATKHMPLSIAYPIWTGIGAVGAVLIGVIFFKENIHLTTWVFVILLIISIVGIKITSNN